MRDIDVTYVEGDAELDIAESVLLEAWDIDERRIVVSLTVDEADDLVGLLMDAIDDSGFYREVVEAMTGSEELNH